jgi:hypothetical protein
MKVTYFVFALLLVSSFANQATAHTRTNKGSHRTHIRIDSLHGNIPLTRSGFLNLYDSSPNDRATVSAGGTMWNGRSASEYGGGAP